MHSWRLTPIRLHTRVNGKRFCHPATCGMCFARQLDFGGRACQRTDKRSVGIRGGKATDRYQDSHVLVAYDSGPQGHSGGSRTTGRFYQQQNSRRGCPGLTSIEHQPVIKLFTDLPAWQVCFFMFAKNNIFLNNF